MQTKEDLMMMFEMRLDGKSLAEIGRQFGITKERVWQLLNGCSQYGVKSLKKCVFPGIATWLREHRMTIKQFRKDLTCFSNSSNTIYSKLCGDKKFTLPEIKAILAYTGMTFDEAFGEEIKPTENASNDVKDDA